MWRISGISKNPDKIRRTIRISVTIAASILLIILLIQVYNFYKLTPTKLFLEKYKAYELPDSVNKSGYYVSPLVKAYHEKKFSEVISLNSKSVVSINDIFITGLSYLETDELSKAISSFQVVLADVKHETHSALKDAAEYYLALGYLKNRDYDQAIELMDTIHHNPSHHYNEMFTQRFINKVKRLKWR